MLSPCRSVPNSVSEGDCGFVVSERSLLLALPSLSTSSVVTAAVVTLSGRTTVYCIAAAPVPDFATTFKE